MNVTDHAVSPNSPLSFDWKKHRNLVAPHMGKVSHHLLPPGHAPTKGNGDSIAFLFANLELENENIVSIVICEIFSSCSHSSS